MKENELNCEAYYWKGKALKGKSQIDNAIENFEQAVNLNKSQPATLKSLLELALIRIQERDIYLAYYTLDRLEEIPTDLPIHFNLKIFLNGAVNMIKKKFKDGLEDFKKIDASTLEEFKIDRLMLSYQAYGNFCLGNIKEALEYYSQLEKLETLVQGDVYNRLLCEGIIKGEEGEYSLSKSFFEKAKSIFRLKVEPTFYIVVNITLQVP